MLLINLVCCLFCIEFHRRINLKICGEPLNYDKKDRYEDNLLTICRSYNSMANIDRSWHTDLYNSIIRNRYGGNI